LRINGSRSALEVVMLYRIVVYLHVVGVLGWLFALGVEVIVLAELAKAATSEQQREALGMQRINRVIGPVAALLVLGPGVYMAETVWSAHPSWVNLGYLTFIAVFVLGAAVTGRITVGLERGLKERAHVQPLAVSLAPLRYSLYARVGLLLGATFAMVVKPQTAGGVSALCAGLAVGLLAAFAANRGGSRSSASTGAAISSTRA
jgi:hypothetical protein